MPRPKRPEPARTYSPPSSAYAPTEEQEILFDATRQALEITQNATHTEIILQVEGVAGCGKTESTVRDAMQHTGYSRKFVAFNTSAAEETEGRLAAVGIHGAASTCHVHGKDQIIKMIGRKPFISKFKTYDLLDKLSITDRSLRRAYSDAVSLAKGELLFAPDRSGKGLFSLADIERMQELLVEHELDSDFKDARGNPINPIDTIIGLVRDSVRDPHNIDFDDMVALPGYYGLTGITSDIFYIDEYQDSNPAQRYLALKLSGKTLVAIGDPNQAIYAFRGAGNDSMAQLERAAVASNIEFYQLSLSFNWRCDSRIIALAQQLVPRIQARPNAPEGEIQTHLINPDITQLCGESYRDSATNPSTSMIISRRNAPLIRYMFSMITNGIPAYRKCKPDDPVEKALKRLMTHLSGSRTKEAAVTELERYIDEKRTEIDEVYGDDQTSKAKKSRAKLERLSELLDCGKVLISMCQTPSALPHTLELLTPKTPPKDSVTLSTIHKAKGTEADRVYIIDTETLGADLTRRVNKQTGQMQVYDHPGSQELNIAYVALTRAKRYLGFEGPAPHYLEL